MDRPYRTYGELIHAWRNEITHTREMVAHETDIPIDRLECLERGEKKPDWAELELLSKHFYVNVRDLLPQESDLSQGIKVLRAKAPRKIERRPSSAQSGFF